MAARIVIIGGGLIGSAVASFLGERGFGATVTVIERDPTYKAASSALSASSIDGSGPGTAQAIGLENRAAADRRRGAADYLFPPCRDLLAAGCQEHERDSKRPL